MSRKDVAEIHGKYGTAEVTKYDPGFPNDLLFDYGYDVKSPGGDVRNFDDLNSAIEHAQRASGQK